MTAHNARDWLARAEREYGEVTADPAPVSALISIAHSLATIADHLEHTSTASDPWTTDPWIVTDSDEDGQA